jgi:lipoprotein-releasing system permease protein
MPYPLLIGRRAILSRENRLLINFTTWIAVLGVALGVAALVVVNAVYDGYIAEIRARFVSVLAHIEIEGGRGGYLASVRGDPQFLDFLESQPGVEAAAPLLKRQALLIPRRGMSTHRAGAVVLGIDLERTRRVTQLIETIDTAHGSRVPGPGEVVLGYALAERLGVGIGGQLVAITDIDTSRNRRRPEVRRATLTVCGVFHSGFYQFDQTLAFLPIDEARRIYGVDSNVADAVDLRLANPAAAVPIADALARQLPLTRIVTWQEQYSGFFAGVELTRVALLLILLVLVLVACSNVIGSLTMMVNDRTRAIGILRAMGATRMGLATIFLLCGAVTGVLGIVLGFGIGWLVCWALESGRLISVPPSVYFIDHLPIAIDWVKIGLVAAVTMAICLGASVIPALRAARLDPVEALRHE